MMGMPHPHTGVGAWPCYLAGKAVGMNFHPHPSTPTVPLKSLGSGSDLTLPSSSEADTLERHDLALLAGSAPTLTRDEILERRRKHYGPNLALFFPEDPLHVTSAVGCRLYTSDSREEADSYLDCINNVSHVGHCHPQVGWLLRLGVAG